MKNLKLENFGVQELDAKEIVQTDGGNPWWAVISGYIIWEIVTNPKAHAKAAAGWNSVPHQF